MAQNQLMTVEESYVERRQLFKDIWDTAMHMDEKDGDILNKPKVIKTLRLSDVDRSHGRKKKQRIKNLRAVCKKILEFCDKQDADDIFYEQITAEGHVAPHKTEPHTKKRKLKARKKIKKSHSLFTPHKDVAHHAQPRAIVSDGKDNFVNPRNKSTRNASPMQYGRPLVVKKPYTPPKLTSVAPSVTARPIKLVSSMEKISTNNKTPPRKIVKKKSNPKKKKIARDHVSPLKINVLQV